MEYWDLIDASGRSLGETIRKGEKHPQGTYHLVIGVWTVTEDGKALLTKRSLEERQYPGKWENTGGCAQSGETGIQCAIRELREEVGIEADRESLKYLGTRLERTALVRIYGLRVQDDRISLRLQASEIADAGWFTREQWENMIREGSVSEAAEGRMRCVEKALTDMGFC